MRAVGSGFRHVGLDVAWLLFPFPNYSAHYGVLPAEVVQDAETAYGQRLEAAVPEAGDDRQYDEMVAVGLAAAPDRADPPAPAAVERRARRVRLLATQDAAAPADRCVRRPMPEVRSAHASGRLVRSPGGGDGGSMAGRRVPHGTAVSRIRSCPAGRAGTSATPVGHRGARVYRGCPTRHPSRRRPVHTRRVGQAGGRLRRIPKRANGVKQVRVADENEPRNFDDRPSLLRLIRWQLDPDGPGAEVARLANDPRQLGKRSIRVDEVCVLGRTVGLLHDDRERS